MKVYLESCIIKKPSSRAQKIKIFETFFSEIKKMYTSYDKMLRHSLLFPFMYAPSPSTPPSLSSPQLTEVIREWSLAW